MKTKYLALKIDNDRIQNCIYDSAYLHYIIRIKK